MRYAVTRVHADGQTLTWGGLDGREARQLVAWCAADNLGMTRPEANRRADEAFAEAVPYVLGPYAFTAIEETQAAPATQSGPLLVEPEDR